MNPKRVAVGVGAALVLGALVATWSVYSESLEIDACVSLLSKAAGGASSLDAPPSLRDELQRAHEIDTEFVRPGASSDWVRVGLKVLRTSTSAPYLIVVGLSRPDLPSCRFLPDHERSGPFGEVPPEGR